MLFRSRFRRTQPATAVDPANRAPAFFRRRSERREIVRPEKYSSSLPKLFKIRNRAQAPSVSFRQRLTNRMNQDPVTVRSRNRVAPGIEIGPDPFGVLDRDLGREADVQRPNQRRRRMIPTKARRNNLPTGVNAAVGPSRAPDRRPRPTDRAERFLKLPLDRSDAGYLALEALERRSIVRDCKFVMCFGRAARRFRVVQRRITRRQVRGRPSRRCRLYAALI